MTEQLSTLQKLIDQAVAFIVAYSFQVVGALIVLTIGVVFANSMSGLFLNFLKKKNVDITLSKFLAGTLRILILGFAVLIALGKFGITIAPFIAFLSAAAFGASFAIKGPLSNYGAGLSIILSRPFAVGDTVTIKDVSGVVDDIKLANTRLINEDGVAITIPNNQVVGEILYNSKNNKVVEAVIGVSYDSDPEKATVLIRRELEKFTDVVKVPPPQVGIQEFGDFSINIGFRYWVPTTRYFQVSYAVNLAVFRAIQAAKISIPFPQREVRIISQSSNQNLLNE
jgi:small conductance mechanosensitive channel